jgi:hypothetical protein
MMLVFGVIKRRLPAIDLLSFSLRGLMTLQRILMSAVLLTLATVPSSSKPAQAAGEVTTKTRPSGPQARKSLMQNLVGIRVADTAEMCRSVSER